MSRHLNLQGSPHDLFEIIRLAGRQESTAVPQCREALASSFPAAADASSAA
jgi:hypothetical protein